MGLIELAEVGWAMRDVGLLYGGDVQSIKVQWVSKKDDWKC